MKKTATLLMFVLQELGGERSATALAQFIFESPDVVEAELDALVLSASVAVKESQSQKKYYVLKPLEEDSLDIIYHAANIEGIEDILSYFFAKERHDILYICTALLERMERYLATSATLGAMLCLELLLRYLHVYLQDIPKQKDTARFLELVLNTSDIAMYLTKHLEQALRLVIESRKVVDTYDDTSTKILFAFVEICLENMHAECSAKRLQELRAEWLKVLAELDSPELASSLKYFLGMFHFWEGNFVEVLNFFADSVEPPHMWRGLFQTQMFSLYTSSSALYLGRFHQSVGILESARRTSELKHDRFKALWWEAQLAMVLLYMNQCDAALELIDHVVAAANPESETKILAWGMRGLAYFHWRKGNMSAAYYVLKNALEMTRKNSIGRLIYSYPWMFDMLYSFHKDQYAPIEGARLEDELLYALEGPNKHLQASALRTLARIRLDGGCGIDDALLCFQESLTLFETVGNPLEVARTHVCIAHCLALQKKHAQAQALLAEAKQVFIQYEQDDMDFWEVKPSAHSAKISSEMMTLCDQVLPAYALPFSQEQKKPSTQDALGSIHENPVKNCQLALEALPPFTTTKAFFKHMTRIACIELGAERAILFLVHRGGAVQAKARVNITHHELKTSEHATKLSRIYSGLGNHALILEEDNSVCVVMPLQTVKNERWFLYLESRYAIKALQSLSTAHLEEAVNIFSRELYAALRHTAASKDENITPLSTLAPPTNPTDIFLYSAPIMRQLVSKSRQVATTQAPVLISGETGVGKELLAHFVHECSGRTGAFIPVHPASIAENLFESEFFGHEKGSFTGAVKQKMGLVEMAHQGTLFIDEVGDIPPSIQVKLLRVFQNKCFTRVGGNTQLHSDFRLVGATNKNLQEEIHAGRFREDLYYRMAVVPLFLPPLRERKEDIPLLAEFFLDLFSKQYHRNVPKLDTDTLETLTQYTWPGNARELKSVIERAVILYRHGSLDVNLRRHPTEKHTALELCAEPFEQCMTELPTLEELQNKYVRYVLQQTAGKVTGPKGALEILGIKRSTFYAKFRQEQQR